MRIPRASMSSLSHSMTVRSAMAAFSMGTSSRRRSSVITKPPTCWERWRGNPRISLVRAMKRRADGARGSRPCFARPEPSPIVVGPPLHVLGEAVHELGREAQGLAHLAHGAAAAVADDLGGQGGAVPAVAAVDVLEHLLAPLVLEVDVDVRRLVPLLGQEALEEQVDAIGVDGGDAQAVADRRVRGRAASLAQDPLAPREAHDVVHGEEVRRVVELLDQRELVLDARAHVGRDGLAVALRGAPPGGVDERLEGRAAVLAPRRGSGSAAPAARSARPPRRAPRRGRGAPRGRGRAAPSLPAP